MYKIEREFEEFCEQLLKAVKSRFPENVKVEIHKVLKNNSLELESMVILSECEKISPNFYLQLFYEEYLSGMSITLIAEQIEKLYEEAMKNGKDMELDMSFESCAKRIFFRLVSYRQNCELLQTIPFIRFLDMAVTFHILLRMDEDGIGSVRITNQLLESWKLDDKKLFVLARENTMRLFPKRMCNMLSMMDKILEGEESSAVWNIPEEKDAEMTGEPYVVTNSNGINGAAVILYPCALAEIGSFFGRDYYLLPSSIHEFLAIPVSAPISVEEMYDMVREVNATCVAKEEILSEAVYRYHCATDTVSICENNL